MLKRWAYNDGKRIRYVYALTQEQADAKVIKNGWVRQ